MRVVVNLVGDAAHGQLAESRFVPRRFLPGGEHNMYELAFGAAANGYDVELRGWLDSTTFERLATGAEQIPRTELPPRPPTESDLVVVPEGWRDPLDYARLLLSPACLALFVLAAPGLFGWPFADSGWEPPDPLTVDLDALAQPVHFQAIHALGFHILTHSPGIARAAEAAGVPCNFVGTGRPSPPTRRSDGAKSIDAVGLLANRWAPFVREVAGELDGLAVDLLEEAPNQVVLDRFEQAKVLIWPSRIEGHATVPWEARSLGCVPVALSSNRFAVGLNDDTGAVVVDEVSEIAPAIRTLLGNESRWRELSERGIRTAPREVDWKSYKQRVGAFLESMEPAGPEKAALAGMGVALEQWLETRAAEAQDALAELHAELEQVRADRDAQYRERGLLQEDRHRLAHELGEIRAEEQRVRADRDRLAAELNALLARRAVRMALRADQISGRKRRS